MSSVQLVRLSCAWVKLLRQIRKKSAAAATRNLGPSPSTAIASCPGLVLSRISSVTSPSKLMIVHPSPKLISSNTSNSCAVPPALLEHGRHGSEGLRSTAPLLACVRLKNLIFPLFVVPVPACCCATIVSNGVRTCCEMGQHQIMLWDVSCHLTPASSRPVLGSGSCRASSHPRTS